MAGKGGYNASEPRDYHGRWSGDGGGENRGTSEHAPDAAGGAAKAKQGMVRVSVSRPMGFEVADIGPGGVKHNVKTGTMTTKPDGSVETRYTNGDYGTKYNPASVDKAINNASRYQGKVSSGERSAIHRLLKGRH